MSKIWRSVPPASRSVTVSSSRNTGCGGVPCKACSPECGLAVRLRQLTAGRAAGSVSDDLHLAFVSPYTLKLLPACRRTCLS